MIQPGFKRCTIKGFAVERLGWVNLEAVDLWCCVLRCTINVRLILPSTHTIHLHPTSSRVISITLIPPDFFLLLSSLILLQLIGKVHSCLCQLTSISLERMQRLLLLLKFSLMALAHIALMLQLYLERVYTLQCLTK